MAQMTELAAENVVPRGHICSHSKEVDSACDSELAVGAMSVSPESLQCPLPLAPLPCPVPCTMAAPFHLLSCILYNAHSTVLDIPP